MAQNRTPPALALPSTPADAVRHLLDLDDPEAAVGELSSVSLHRLLSEVGLVDAGPLLELASAEQVRDVLDLELWQGDQLRPGETLDWLHMLGSLPDKKFAGAMAALDVELVGTALLQRCQVHLIEDADEPPELTGGSAAMETPDRWFYIEVIKGGPVEAQKLFELVRSMYRADPDDTRRLLHCLTWEVPTELQELSYRWRNGRLQDLGFADPERALLVYSYLKPQSVKPGEKTKDIPLRSDPEPAGSVAVDFWSEQPDSFWRRAAGRIDSSEEQRRLATGLAELSNRTLSADRVDPADREAVRASLAALHWRLSLGLEYVAGGELDPAVEVLGSVALIRLARVGFSLTLDLRSGLLPAAREGWLGSGPGQADLLDPPLRNSVQALLAPRPAYHPADLAAPRPFHDLADIRHAVGWIRQVESVVALAQQQPRPDDLPDSLTHGDLFRTVLVNRLLGREGALDRDALARFIETHCGENGLSAEVWSEVAKVADDRPQEAEVVRRWTATLANAVASLDPRGLDLRFVDSLWLAKKPN